MWFRDYNTILEVAVDARDQFALFNPTASVNNFARDTFNYEPQGPLTACFWWRFDDLESQESPFLSVAISDGKSAL